jgi:hypothetical protein
MAMDRTNAGDFGTSPHEVRAEYTNHPKFRKNNGISLPHVLREKEPPYIPNCSREMQGLSEIMLRGYSALVLCKVHVFAMLPRLWADEKLAPFMNQMAVFPVPSRQRRSLFPSPL